MAEVAVWLKKVLHIEERTLFWNIELNMDVTTCIKCEHSNQISALDNILLLLCYFHVLRFFSFFPFPLFISRFIRCFYKLFKCILNHLV